MVRKTIVKQMALAVKTLLTALQKTFMALKSYKRLLARGHKTFSQPQKVVTTLNKAEQKARAVINKQEKPTPNQDSQSTVLKAQVDLSDPNASRKESSLRRKKASSSKKKKMTTKKSQRHRQLKPVAKPDVKDPFIESNQV